MGEAKRKKGRQPPPDLLPGDAGIVLLCADAFRACSRRFREGSWVLKRRARKDKRTGAALLDPL